ncbi:MAG TPA: MarR family transcriptional regulator, partial [Candidatus Paceibacterota bacterium]|nr:MarR family transcriptional regulator [Candidatus Paceibacterota bacterium]
GVHPTDLMAASYLSDEGPMTAGELAKAIGLTTGAMTAAIDRLERAGFATRETDPRDRRKVIIVPVKVHPKLLAMRVAAVERIKKIFSHYNDKELSLMVGAMNDMLAAFGKEIPNLKKELDKNKKLLRKS